MEQRREKIREEEEKEEGREEQKVWKSSFIFLYGKVWNLILFDVFIELCVCLAAGKAMERERKGDYDFLCFAIFGEISL